MGGGKLNNRKVSEAGKCCLMLWAFCWVSEPASTDGMAPVCALRACGIAQAKQAPTAQADVNDRDR